MSFVDSLDRLTKIFQRFPGIGPRQAGRFVQFLLRSSPTLRRELIEAVKELGGSVRECPECMRFHADNEKTCGICADSGRDRSALAVVATDSDLAALERSGNFRGRYFVLGGTISLATEKNPHLRTKQLLASLPDRAAKGLEEIILAFPANPEGDATADAVRASLSAYQGEALIITTLGRGLSTGSELEYADPDTIKSALDSRR